MSRAWDWADDSFCRRCTQYSHYILKSMVLVYAHVPSCKSEVRHLECSAIPLRMLSQYTKSQMPDVAPKHPSLPSACNQKKPGLLTGPLLYSGRRSLRSGLMSGCHCAKNVIATEAVSFSCSTQLSPLPYRGQYIPHINQQLQAERMSVLRQTL